jgi:hypothetical protein
MALDNQDGNVRETYTYELNGQTITAKRQDPYGFLYISSDKPLHQHLEGVFTTTWDLERAIRETKALIEEEDKKKKKNG